MTEDWLKAAGFSLIAAVIWAAFKELTRQGRAKTEGRLDRLGLDLVDWKRLVGLSLAGAAAVLAGLVVLSLMGLTSLRF